MPSQAGEKNSQLSLMQKIREKGIRQANRKDWKKTEQIMRGELLQQSARRKNEMERR